MTEKVRYEVTDHVAMVTITRPDVRNAIDLDVFRLLGELGRRAASDPDVRAVVLAGEGANFSSGIDTTVFTAGSGGDVASIDIEAFQSSFSIYEHMPMPTIAALAGPTFGAGFQLALACDFRVASEDVSLSVMEVQWGIMPDLGATHRLPRLAGLARAKELVMTARRLGSGDALTWGIVNRVVPAGEHVKHAVEWARELAAGPPLALAAIKRVMNAAFEESVEQGLKREAAAQRRILSSQDFVEAVTARMQKRSPAFAAR